MRGRGAGLSVRTMLELVALAGVGTASWKLAEESRPPGPEIRALRDGGEPDRVAAVRSIGLMGDAGIPALAALVEASREDPSPAVRRGAADALMRLAIAEPGFGFPLPIDEVLAGPGTQAAPLPPGTPPPAPPFPLLHPRAGEAAANLAEVIRGAPDPSVRLYALRALRKILDVAMAERGVAWTRREPGGALPEHPASGGWVEAAARAIADRTTDAEPEVAAHAVGFLSGSRGRDAIPEPERVAALLSGIEAGTLELPTELLAMNVAAQGMGADHPDRERLLDLAVARMDDPPDCRDEHFERWADEERDGAAGAGYGQVAWGLIRSVDDFRRRPDAAGRLLAALEVGGPDDSTRPPGARLVVSLFARVRPLVADRFESGGGGGMSARYSGKFPPNVTAHESALRVIEREPDLLGDLWPRLEPRTRFGWLAESEAFFDLMKARPGMAWEPVMAILSESLIAPDLPADRCREILAHLLDDPEPEPDGETLLLLSIRFRGGSSETPNWLESAHEIQRLRALVVMAYFARGAAGGGGEVDEVDELVARLRPFLGSAIPEARARAAWLLGSLGRSASPALAELEALAEAGEDEGARFAAEAAVEAIRRAGEGR